MFTKTIRSGVLAAAMVATGSSATDFGDPLPGLTPAQQTAFQNGKAAFVKMETPADGLGPIFNENSCLACHLGPAGGAANGAAGGTTERLETRFGMSFHGGHQFDPLVNEGGSLMQDHAIGAAAPYLTAAGIVPTPYCQNLVFVPETVPDDANVMTGRRSIPLFGLGLVDAVPDSTLVALSTFENTLFPDTAGVLSTLINVDTGQPAIGRFGWKAQVPTLHVFGGDAYLNEMGVTNPSFPNESCPQGDCSTADGHPLSCNPAPALNDDGSDVQNFTNFMQLLAPPPRGPVGFDEVMGEIIFAGIGCAQCHTPTLITGASPIGALDHVQFQPYSDFLLHDMGSLGDGITQNQATGQLMRTQPLWGLRAQTSFLHDGRALTLSDAIIAHDGQGYGAAASFGLLDDTSRALLLAFLNSL
ncbi:MAG: hypothetical protein E6J78_13520 [Deltaproteobacteria bacterium]|nr:MAG: hypothetical protein E6J78_13520 [Deltaproteobacteria bacterium]